MSIGLHVLLVSFLTPALWSPRLLTDVYQRLWSYDKPETATHAFRLLSPKFYRGEKCEKWPLFSPNPPLSALIEMQMPIKLLRNNGAYFNKKIALQWCLLFGFVLQAIFPYTNQRCQQSSPVLCGCRYCIISVTFQQSLILRNMSVLLLADL